MIRYLKEPNFGRVPRFPDLPEDLHFVDDSFVGANMDENTGDWSKFEGVQELVRQHYLAIRCAVIWGICHPRARNCVDHFFNAGFSQLHRPQTADNALSFTFWRFDQVPRNSHDECDGHKNGQHKA
jgi:hypothetical protein